MDCTFKDEYEGTNKAFDCLFSYLDIYRFLRNIECLVLGFVDMLCGTISWYDHFKLGVDISSPLRRGLEGDRMAR